MYPNERRKLRKCRLCAFVNILFAVSLAMAYWAVAVLVAPVLFGGCIYKGAKVVEGTDLAIGITIPQADGAAQLDVLNYLSGFRLGVAENAGLVVRYSVAESNEYFGVITTRTAKTIDAKVTPCETTAAAEK